MLEIEQLEREWRRYKIKRLQPLMILFGLMGGGIIALVFWPNLQTSFNAFQPNRSNVAKEEKTAHQKPNTTPKRVVSSLPTKATVEPKQPRVQKPIKPEAKPDQTPSQPIEKSVVLNPDTEFLNSFGRPGSVNNKTENSRKDIVRHETIPVVKERPQEARQKNVLGDERLGKAKSFSEKKNNAIQEKTDQKETEESSEPTKSSSLVIQTKQTNNTLDYLIERFNQSRDPKLATYIAQSFYKKGNYQETVKWSVIANSIEPSNEESWLLFAKAKAKLGQREDAISALRIYLNQYSSRKVKSYLESLEGGL